MRSLGHRLFRAAAPRVGYAYIRLLKATMRLDFRNREVLNRARREHGQYVVAFWHSRLALMPYGYPAGRIVVLSSQHRDAQLLVEILARFGVVTAWGSSTRGGVAGLRQILRCVEEGYDVGLTPDGPRGPRRQVQPGVIAIARLTGKPIVPLTFSARPMHRVNTWDRTLVPYPFGRALFAYGEPILVPRQADEGTQHHYRLLLQAELDRLTDDADRELGILTEGEVEAKAAS